MYIELLGIEFTRRFRLRDNVLSYRTLGYNFLKDEGRLAVTSAYTLCIALQ
jgi:hypothetical protein